jgi:hypothetical protein
VFIRAVEPIPLALPDFQAAISVPMILSAPESELRTRWVNLFGSPSSSSPTIPLKWIVVVPSRIGSSPLVDQAVAYAADNYLAYCDPDDERKRMQAHRSGSKAIRSLRAALAATQYRGNTGHLILAASVHFFAEVCGFDVEFDMKILTLNSFSAAETISLTLITCMDCPSF